ncbi:uncharacterized protein LOC124924806 [Impatiens glandulifera]|uniref:uncharacterized protein LOC124924806 n=1 Tax=Impatiens glandulifera TaxID=253017 RepID=UPI001FB0CF86|nr:uncharacterized protein LOC124924806 [Impatiens glandulifera]
MNSTHYLPEGERMEDEAVIFEPYELNYFDMIILLSSKSAKSSSSSSMSRKENERMESIIRNVMQNLGPDGPGLLTVTNVPYSADLRRKLLPLARRLALLDAQHRTRLLKEQGLGSDVPLRNHNHDRRVSSFAMQLKYSHCDSVDDIEGDEMDNIGDIFKKLGLIMMEVGHLLAQICDIAIGGHELEQSLSDSCSTAKGRLIHYHSISDNLALNKKKTAKAKQIVQASSSDRLWQEWHYDYGLFTLLTSPIFLSNSHHHTHTRINSGLEIFHQRMNQVLAVKSPPPDSFLVQVGESAEILSQGKIRANLHSVRKQAKIEEEEDLSRETFVVFLQPGWNQSFSISDEFMKNHHSSNNSIVPCKEIEKIVPPLLSRMKDGMTFAEFSKQTTQQYYGGRSGLQSNK